tara:strand:+ start:389 stop:739 length:351 start_codon:yes stop_codon:yes gene_type:complete
MSKEEQRLQTSIVKYIKLAFPNTLFTATMGGVKLNSWSQRNALKSTGYLKGVADLLIFESKGMYKGLFIELKTLKGKMTKEQKQFQTNAIARGYLCVCCKGFDDTKKIIDDYLNEI